LIWITLASNAILVSRPRTLAAASAVRQYQTWIVWGEVVHPALTNASTPSANVLKGRRPSQEQRRVETLVPLRDVLEGGVGI